MKVIFLDIDGVLNSAAFFASGPHGFGDIDPAPVARLEQLLARSGAQVVISSTWRLAFSPAELRARLAAKGFTGEILGCTPEVPTRATSILGAFFFPRCAEIRAWLAAQAVPPERFVILDDAELEPADLVELQPCFVRTDPERGLQDGDVEAAVRILEG
ncbi:MAG: HAD domain-containing protein [Byssovorax sp.]